MGGALHSEPHLHSTRSTHIALLLTQIPGRQAAATALQQHPCLGPPRPTSWQRLRWRSTVRMALPVLSSRRWVPARRSASSTQARPFSDSLHCAQVEAAVMSFWHNVQSPIALLPIKFIACNVFVRLASCGGTDSSTSTISA